MAYKKLLSPKGTFLFASLNAGQPDEYEGSSKYKVNLVCETEEEFIKVQEACDEVLAKYMQAENLDPADWTKKPIVTENSFIDKETGDKVDWGYMIYTDMNSEIKVKDKDGKNTLKNMFETMARMSKDGKTPLGDSYEIHDGDIGRVVFLLKPWDFKGMQGVDTVGVRLMLCGVQVIEARGSGAADLFQDESEDDSFGVEE